MCDTFFKKQVIYLELVFDTGKDVGILGALDTWLRCYSDFSEHKEKRDIKLTSYFYEFNYWAREVAKWFPVVLL